MDTSHPGYPAQPGVRAGSRSRIDFLSNLSHEIRTPLTAILGYADLLVGQLKNPDDISLAQVIQRAGHCLLEVVSRELEVAKLEAGMPAIKLLDTRPLVDPRSAPLAVTDCSVLLVEDHPVAATAMRLLLTSLGCTVLVAATGGEALEMAGRGRVDLMLLDLQLPDMTGYELLDAIVDLLGDASTPVVAHTGHHPSEVGVTPGGVAFWEVLQKPATATQLLRLIEATRSRSGLAPA